jgi:hypothetical protein
MLVGKNQHRVFGERLLDGGKIGGFELAAEINIADFRCEVFGPGTMVMDMSSNPSDLQP